MEGRTARMLGEGNHKISVGPVETKGDICRLVKILQNTRRRHTNGGSVGATVIISSRHVR